jgi:predicted anti-sigma-YlaC factor YlaD
MKPCAHIEALEAHALSIGEGDSWLEAHVAECADCAAELDRLLEERALFTRRAVAEAVVVTPDVATVFAELDRRRERFRKTGVLASLVAAAAACVAMAFTPQMHQGMHAGSGAGRRAMAETSDGQPALGGATASADDLQMSLRVAACMPGHDVLVSACDAPAGALPLQTTDTQELAMTSGGASGGSWWPSACVPDVTCSVAGP